MKRQMLMVTYRNGEFGEAEIKGNLRTEDGFFVATMDAPVETTLYINRREVVHIVLEEVQVH
jgi:TFIIF-interacting CTD phosphatase-like protein